MLCKALMFFENWPGMRLELWKKDAAFFSVVTFVASRLPGSCRTASDAVRSTAAST
jgi:hypothetical protein